MNAELEEGIDIALETDIAVRNQRFIREAIYEWDKLEGKLPSYPCFIKLFVQLKWEEYAKRN